MTLFDYEFKTYIETSIGNILKALEIKEDKKKIFKFDHDLFLEQNVILYMLKAIRFSPTVSIDLLNIVFKNVDSFSFKNSVCFHIFNIIEYLHKDKVSVDLLSIMHLVDSTDAIQLIEKLLNRKICEENFNECFESTILRLKQKKWLSDIEDLRFKISSGKYNDDEVLKLSVKFFDLKRSFPKIVK